MSGLINTNDRIVPILVRPRILDQPTLLASMFDVGGIDHCTTEDDVTHKYIYMHRQIYKQFLTFLFFYNQINSNSF